MQKLNESSVTMHTASELCCIKDDSKSCGFLYSLQHNHSECYHQSQLKRTRRCKKLNKSSITIMHTASEVCCIHDDFSYPLQYNHSECYHQSQLNRARRCKKLNQDRFTYMRAAKAKSSLYKCAFSQERSLLVACTCI